MSVTRGSADSFIHDNDRRLQAWTYATLNAGTLEWASCSPESEKDYTFLNYIGGEVVNAQASPK